MTMTTRQLDKIDRNMDQQNDFVKELLDLIKECRDKGCTDGLTEEDVQQLENHCMEIKKAADTAKALASNLRPMLEDKEKEKKAAEKTDVKKPKKSKKVKEEAPAEDEELDFLG